MRKFAFLLFNLLLLPTVIGTAYALPCFESHSENHAIWKGYAHHLHFASDSTSHDKVFKARSEAPGFIPVSDAVHLTNPDDYLPAIAFAVAAPHDQAGDTAKRYIAAWNQNGDSSARFDLANLLFNSSDRSPMPSSHIFLGGQWAPFSERASTGDPLEILGDNDLPIESATPKVPESSALVLLGIGLIGLAVLCRKRILR